MKPAKKSARERLMEYVGGDGSVDYMGADARKHAATVRRLLREHDLEMAEHHAQLACEAVHRGPTAYESDLLAAIRAAILGPRAAKRGGR